MPRLTNLLVATACCAGMAGCSSAPTASPARTGAPVACTSPATSGPDVDAIKRLEERGARVNVDGWSIEDARAFFAPEWVSVQPNGTDSTLETVLSAFQNGRSVPWAGRFDITNLDIRVYCDTAVAIGRADAYRIGAAGPGAQPAVRLHWLNVWRKMDGRWVYAANQFTRY